MGETTDPRKAASTGATTDISRRRALKKGLVLGTAPLWAVPTMQVIGVSRASAQQTSPGPTTTSTTTTTTPSTCEPIDDIQIVVRRDDDLYGLRYKEVWNHWSADRPDPKDCIQYYAGAVQADPLVALVFKFEVPVEEVDECLWRIVSDLPDGYTFVAGWAKAGDATDGGCHPATVVNGDITFSSS